eukprot:9162130-Pyramimonas_sp.AAC.1
MRGVEDSGAQRPGGRSARDGGRGHEYGAGQRVRDRRPLRAGHSGVERARAGGRAHTLRGRHPLRCDQN